MEGSASLSYSTEADDWAWSEMLMFCVTVGHNETRELTQFMFCSKINAHLCNTLFTWISLLLGMLWLVGPQQQKQLTRGELFLPLPCRYKWRRHFAILYCSIQDVFQFFSFLSATMFFPLNFVAVSFEKCLSAQKKTWQILARGLVRMADTLLPCRVNALTSL